ncbi:hypothetical protein GCK32_007670 [Trichostrongylus colubriformis]|uniref:Uncharacterized protein n=1 Tax=Trichostrongylus colubriformis TaxID=6319 RepID=A0AAN8IM84_TRICO
MAEDLPLATLTKSLQHLDVGEVPSADRSATPPPASAGSPPTKMMRSGSSRRLSTDPPFRSGWAPPRDQTSSSFGSAASDVAGPSWASAPLPAFPSASQVSSPSAANPSQRQRARATPSQSGSGRAARGVPRGEQLRLVEDLAQRAIKELDPTKYRHLPDSGYMSARFNRSLFPQVTFREDRPPREGIVPSNPGSTGRHGRGAYDGGFRTGTRERGRADPTERGGEESTVCSDRR